MTKELKFNEIKIGQKLKAIRNSYSLNLSVGDIVTVSDLSPSSRSLQYVYINGDENTSGRGLGVSHFELYEEVEIKVGDTVEVIENGYGVATVDKGKRAVVVGFSDTRLLIDGSHFTYDGYGDKSRISCNPKSVKKVNVIDFTKPVFTMEGTPVEIVTTKGRDEKFPVLAYEGKAKEPSKFNLSGISKMGVARRNLTNTVPKREETVVRFANVYRSGDGLSMSSLHFDRANADASATEGRVGVAKVTVHLVEGYFAE